MTQKVQNYVSGGAHDSQTNVTTSATYDALGQTLTATDALGVVSQNVYDQRGNLMQSTANYVSGGAHDAQTNVTTQFGYDALGRRVSATDPKGVVTQTTYDVDGNTTQTVANYLSGGAHDNHTNVTTTTAYDAAGNATLATDARGATTTTTVDRDNRAVEAVVKDGGGTTLSDRKTAYDGAGRKVSAQVMDGDTNPTITYGYDLAGRLRTTTAPPATTGGNATVTTTTYDADGQVTATKVTSAATVVTEAGAAYDALGRPTRKTEEVQAGAGAQTSLYAYDASGRTTSTTDPKGRTTTLAHDALGRTTLATHLADGSAESVTYDLSGRILVDANSAGSTTYTYDALGRVATEVRKDGGGVVQTTVTHHYDANGNDTQPTTTFPGGAQTTTGYSFDALNRVLTMSDGTRNYNYDLNGNVLTMQVYGAGGLAYEADASWDGANRSATLTNKVGPSATQLNSYTYHYDARDNQTQTVENGTTTNYLYDHVNELTQVQDSTHTPVASYTYDANHNRTTLVTSAGTTHYSYDAAMVELQSATDPSGKVTSYAYDAQSGSLTSATYDPAGAHQVTSYGYDASERLNLVTKPDSTTVQFAYDADGQRTVKRTTPGGGGAAAVVNDSYQLGRLAYETDGTGTMLASFTYDGEGTPTSVTVGSDPTTAPRYYYVYNGHGDVVALTDSGGNVVASYAYDVFGALTVDTESFANGWHNPYLYDGKDRARYDVETGLYWLSVRAYDPTLGRFISRDPLGRKPAAGGGPGMPYVYCGDNPLTCADAGGEYSSRIFEEDGNFYGPTRNQVALTPTPPPPHHITPPSPPISTVPGGHRAPRPVAHAALAGYGVGTQAHDRHLNQAGEAQSTSGSPVDTVSAVQHAKDDANATAAEVTPVAVAAGRSSLDAAGSHRVVHGVQRGGGAVRQVMRADQQDGARGEARRYREVRADLRMMPGGVERAAPPRRGRRRQPAEQPRRERPQQHDRRPHPQPHAPAPLAAVVQQRRRQQIRVGGAARAERAIDREAVPLVVARHRGEERAPAWWQRRRQDGAVLRVRPARGDGAPELIDAIARHTPAAGGGRRRHIWHVAHHPGAHSNR